MVYDTAKKLASELQASEEYRAYTLAKQHAMESTTTRSLIEEYNRLQIRAQAAVIAGESDGEIVTKLQKIGELLQFDKDASAYLMEEYRLKRMLGDVYKILAEAVEIDLSPLEA
jgi:cell fate (sporulation/competence/biofilm development) regulator YlbF (YheA/YmcA/DUF963 family)